MTFETFMESNIPNYKTLLDEKSILDLQVAFIESEASANIENVIYQASLKSNRSLYFQEDIEKATINRINMQNKLNDLLIETKKCLRNLDGYSRK